MAFHSATASLKGALRDHSAVWVGLRGTAQLTEFVGWVLLAAQLGAADVGRLVTVYLVCRYGGLLSDWGAAFGGTRLVARDPEDGRIRALVRHRRRMTAAVSVTLAVGFTLAGHVEALPLIGVTVYRGTNREWLALGRGEQAAGGLPPLVASMGFVIAAGISESAAEAALFIGLAQGAGTLLSLLLTRLPNRSGARGRGLDGWLTVLTLGDQLYISSDTLVLALLISSEAAGVYSTLYRFPAALLAAFSLVALGSLPSIARTSDLTATLRRIGRIGLMMAGTILLALPGFQLALTVVVGRPYSDELPVLALLTVSLSIAALVAPLTILFVVQRSDKELALLSAGVGAGNVLANLVLVGHYGMLGAAATTLTSYLVLAGYMWFTLRTAAKSSAIQRDPL